MARPTRMELARRRLRVARYSIGAVTVTAFAALGLVVRDAHPATHKSTAAVAAPSAVSPSTVTSSTDESSPSVVISPAPQTVAPTIQSSGS